MEWLKCFFRGTPEDYIFPIWSLKHIAILVIAFIGLEFVVMNKNKLKNTNMGKIFKISMVVILLLQQIVLYLWYGFSGYFSIQESLPLYNCRVATIFTIMAFLTGKKIFKNISCYWGLVGAILVLIFPMDLDPFYFPHYTHISYFVGHMALLWSTAYILVVEEYKMDRESLGNILRFTNIYHFTIYIFNRITNSNYCYLNKAPIAKIFFETYMSSRGYTLTAFLGFNIFMILVYLTAKIAYKILGSDEKLTKFAS